ncbi:DeoR/GlpR family DNA-binding transcription regulator [Treponema sp. HNW]|uniref:DeoR/GlpR family DNA-binding transcription regulator n=1 Tax=Treponema sp. HNW TaxID=3116654 RepID=UPI003D0EECA0
MNKYMKLNTGIFHIERRNQILEMIRNNGQIIVKEVAEKFNVTEVTIRQDLKILEQNGFITRTYGGAVERSHSSLDRPFDERMVKNLPQKIAIAKEAFKLITPGDSMLFDGGTTLLELAKLVNQITFQITIVTNFIPHIQFFDNLENIHLTILGGTYNIANKNLLGMLTTAALHDLFVDKAFLSTTGIDPAYGISCTSFAEAELRKCILEKSKEKILLVDSSKLGKNSFVSCGNINQIDTVITDWGISETAANVLKEKNINLIIANKTSLVDL